MAQIFKNVCLLNADRIYLLLAHFTIIKLPTYLLTVMMFQLYVLYENDNYEMANPFSLNYGTGVLSFW